MISKACERTVLILIFLLLLIWSVFLPTFEVVDEDNGYSFARSISLNGRLPNLKNPNDEGRVHWQPLYYIVLSPMVKILNSPPNDGSAYLKYKASSKRKDNYYIHNRGEFYFSWNRLILTLHLMRLVSVIFSFFTILMIYKIAKDFFYRKKILPILAAMFVGFNPQFINISTSINVVSFVTFTTTLYLYFALYLLKKRKIEYYQSFFLGALAGMAAISKSSALVLIPLGVLQIFFFSKKKIILSVGSFLAGFLLLAGWYFYRNYLLYQDWLAINAWFYQVGNTPQSYLKMIGPVNYFISYPFTQFTTFFNGFGWLTIYYSNLVVFAIFSVFFLSCLGLISYLKYYRKLLDTNQKRMLLIIFLSSLFFWLGVTKVVLIYDAFHGKDLFPVIGPISILFIFGLYYFWQYLREHNPSVKIKVLVSLLYLGISSMFLERTTLSELIEFLVDRLKIPIKHSFEQVNLMQSLAELGQFWILMFLVILSFLIIVENKNLKDKLIGFIYKKIDFVIIFSSFILFFLNLSLLFGLILPILYGGFPLK